MKSTRNVACRSLYQWRRGTEASSARIFLSSDVAARLRVMAACKGSTIHQEAEMAVVAALRRFERKHESLTAANTTPSKK